MCLFPIVFHISASDWIWDSVMSVRAGVEEGRCGERSSLEVVEVIDREVFIIGLELACGCSCCWAVCDDIFRYD